MKIKEVGVKIYPKNYLNDNNFIIVFENKKEMNKAIEEGVYEKKVIGRKGETAYLSINQYGFVSFLMDMKDGRGFYGQEFKLKLKDGSIDKVKGPWSSNAYDIGHIFDIELINCEVCVYNDKSNLLSSCMLLEKAEKICEGTDIIFRKKYHGNEDYRWYTWEVLIPGKRRINGMQEFYFEINKEV